MKVGPERKRNLRGRKDGDQLAQRACKLLYYGQRGSRESQECTAQDYCFITQEDSGVGIP